MFHLLHWSPSLVPGEAPPYLALQPAGLSVRDAYRHFETTPGRGIELDQALFTCAPFLYKLDSQFKTEYTGREQKKVKKYHQEEKSLLQARGAKRIASGNMKEGKGGGGKSQEEIRTVVLISDSQLGRIRPSTPWEGITAGRKGKRDNCVPVERTEAV